MCEYALRGPAAAADADADAELATPRESTGRLVSPPVRIKAHPKFCKLPPPFSARLDAVLWHSGDAGGDCSHYFVSGGHVCEYSLRGAALGDVVPLSEHAAFAELPDSFRFNLDASLWNGRTGARRVDYIFCGGHVVEYSLDDNAQRGKRLRAGPFPLGAGGGGQAA